MSAKYSMAGTRAPGFRWSTGRALALSMGLALAVGGPSLDGPEPVVLIVRAVRDSMNSVFERSNRHWDELSELNSLERMLGTIRPTQREYLGCLQGEVRDGSVRIDAWEPARNMKQLQLAVTGSCEGVPRLVGTWHTHPYHADLRNLPIKERSLSAQDLQTFANGTQRVVVVVWDVDSLDAALRQPDGSIRHPVDLQVK